MWGNISKSEPIWFICKISMCVSTGSIYVKFHEYHNTNVDSMVVIRVNIVCECMGAISESEQ